MENNRTSSRTSLFRSLTFGTLTLFLIALGVYVYQGYEEGELFDTYKCRGNCVPVKFDVQVPKAERLPYVFLSGSFNDWTHGDKTLMLTAINDTLYTLEAELPAGKEIKYRYTIAGNLKYSHGYTEIQDPNNYSEIHFFRYLSAENGLFVQDKVEHWGTHGIRPGPILAEQIVNVQMNFLLGHFEGDSIDVATTDDVDRLFERAVTAWKEESVYYPGDYDGLFSGVYFNLYWMKYSDYIERLYGDNIARAMSNKTLECHLQTSYVLPTFANELAFLKEDINEANAGFLNMGRFALGAVHCPDLSNDAWDLLLASHSNFQETIEKYKPVMSERWQDRNYKSFQEFFAAIEPDFAFQYALQEGDLEEGLRQMEAAFEPAPDDSMKTWLLKQQGITHKSSRLETMMSDLVNRYIASGDDNKALEVLDTVARKFTVFEVSSDTLRSLYQAVSGAAGISHFEDLLANMDRHVFEGQGDPIELSGTYLNITDNSQFDIASLKGKKVVFDFWEIWCGPCIAEIPELISYESQYQNRDDIVLVSVSQDVVSAVKRVKSEKATEAQYNSFKQALTEMVESKGINYVLLLDDPKNPISQHFDLKYYPIKYLVDQDGRLVSEVKSPFDVPL